MDLKLFEHNQKAYKAACQLMDEEGKAAVIHPTGTGKSLIAFQLALDCKDETIVWLSPSAYIFRTQLENVKKILEMQKVKVCEKAEKEKIASGICENNADGIVSKDEIAKHEIVFTENTHMDESESEGVEQIPVRDISMQEWKRTSVASYQFENIQFFTYAKLMHNEDLIARLNPSYIILDEFHRCGASEWGRSVHLLLEAFPDAKVLGLSATNIRYLDNQRDMAQELFDGNIASEMTLGEAIGKKILPAPTYVCAMYDYEQELKRLKKRMEQMKNAIRQQETEQLFEQLRRALERAEGLDVIFERHMKQKKGKYLVFCSNKEHMEEMIACVPEWFSRMDTHPHIYKVSYDNPETQRILDDFKNDNSNHLRLLFCMDMLNEGVHVECLDGVILLRPTVSPILYLQQIGRGLSVGGTEKPLIFDLVNNFDSLYSIHGLAEEAAHTYGIWENETKNIPFDDYFQIIDEVRECRALFESIKRNLSAGWDSYYMEAKLFFQENGHLRIPKNYVSENGLNVGMWLMTQRRVRVGKVVGNLSKEQIELLNAIGMEWGDGSDRKWNYAFGKLQDYYKLYGNIDIPIVYVTDDDFPLGKWISNLRSKWKRNEYEIYDEMGNRIPKDASVKAKLLTVEQMEQLDALGMIWDKYRDQWNKNYIEAEIYWKTYGNLEVPHRYVTEKGIALGVWIENQRKIVAGKKSGAAPISEFQKIRLERIGMRWEREKV